MVLWLVVAAFPIQAQSSETNAATIIAGIVRGIPGSTASVPVSFNHTGVVTAVQFDLNYPTAKLNAGSFLSGRLADNVVLRSRQIAPGQHRFLIYGKNLSLLGTNTTIGGLPFGVPAGELAGGGQLRFTNALASTVTASRVAPLRLSHGAVLVGPLARDGDGVVDLFIAVQPSLTYVIQASTDFTNWVNLTTNVAVLDYIVFKDTAAVDYPMRFYRAVPVGSDGRGMIESLQVPGGGFMALSYPTVSGRTYVVQATTNLVLWHNMLTNIAETSAMIFTNRIDPAYSKQFFRIIESP